MPNDLNLRLGGDMARKWGIRVDDGVAPNISDAALKSQNQSKSARKPSKTPKKQQHTDTAIWDALPKPSAMNARKVLVSVRLDAEVIEFFKESGSGYQTRMNAVLSHYVRTCRARS